MSETYPNAHCELNFKSPFELLVATILSAQCTDKRVNLITEELFKKYNKPTDFALINPEQLENLIRSCGFFRNKTKNIIGASKVILEKYSGQVPDKFEELIKIPGVGRKTANVIMANAFNLPALAVDTHVFRVTNRIGFVNEKTPDKTEIALKNKIKKEKWAKAHHIFIFHGRNLCSSRNPKCQICPVTMYCNYFKEI